jgi:hypothetical protein
MTTTIRVELAIDLRPALEGNDSGKYIPGVIRL